MKRLIVAIEVRDGRAVAFEDGGAERDLGDPLPLAVRLQSEGADEILLQDISTTPESHRRLLDIVEHASGQLTVPLTVGGGFQELSDVEQALRSGADRVSINSAAVQRPAMLTEAAMNFGNHCIVASVDTRMEKRSVENAMRTTVAQAGLVSAATPSGDWYRVYTNRGSTPTMLDAIAWSKQCADLGAGEVLLTSIDQDAVHGGYDLELTARAIEAVSVPVIASGGAARPEHVRDVFLLSGADAALAGALFHSPGTIRGLKEMLVEAGIPVRRELSA